MKAAELVGAERFELRSRERPISDPTDVLIEVSDIRICKSDID